MAQDLLDRFTPFHHHPATVTGGTMAVPIVFHGHTALKFANASGRSAYFKSVMNSLMNSSGVIVTIEWFSSSTSNSAIWTVAFERHSTLFLYTGSSFSAGRSVTSPANTTAYHPVYATINFSPTQMGSIPILESYRISITRSAADTLGADAYVSTISIKNLT